MSLHQLVPPARLSYLLIAAMYLGTAAAQEAGLETDETEEAGFAEIIDANADDTADIDTISTVDTAETTKLFSFIGDFRPLYDYVDRTNRSGVQSSETAGDFRFRAKGIAGITEGIQVGARVAWQCSTDDCALDWYSGSAIPATNGIQPGELTYDELYAHFFRREHFNVTVGRQQTRFVLRGGVFARSLDRNNSNNTNVNWTNGLHATLRRVRGWETHFIVERNSADGAGSIRRGPLDFNYSSARYTYFAGFEKTEPFGPVVQRALTISYLPKSLLVDGDINGQREDYWGIVGRVAARWPQRGEGRRLRAGVELGYAPERPTAAALELDTAVDGLAWNVTASVMDIWPNHSIGINFGQTGAGWLLSPNFVENQEFFEVRYLLRSSKLPPLDLRFRWRQDIEQRINTVQKREVFDAFLRMTFQFGS
jgi:hypothetical protein